MKSLLAAALIAIPLSADAQGQNCNYRNVIIERLASKYGESRQSIGLTSDGRAVETFASLETGTWTVIITMPSGISCLAASGDSFESLNEPVEHPGEDM